jgi:hypothetical protein
MVEPLLEQPRRARVVEVGEQAGAGEHRERVTAVGGLDAGHLGGHPVERLLPAGPPQRRAAPLPDQREQQPVGMGDLLVGDHALGAQAGAG